MKKEYYITLVVLSVVMLILFQYRIASTNQNVKKSYIESNPTQVQVVKI